MERFIRPRWLLPSHTLDRITGAFIALLALLLFAPLPLSNVPVGMVILLLAFAYLEKDGALIAVAGLFTIILYCAAGVTAWGTVSAANWLSS